MSLDNLTVDHFAGHRQPAWLGLGTVFDHEVTDSEEMMRLSGLDQILISEQPLQVVGMPDADFIVPQKALVSENIVEGTSKVLGIVGESRPLIQPREAFSFLQSLGDGKRWEVAGTVRQGRTCFGQIAWDRETVLDPSGVRDVVKSYLTVAFALDGTMALQGGVTKMRAACLNTLNIALKEAKQTFKVKQTKNARDRMAVEAALWREANVYADRFDIAARDLFAVKMTDKKFENVFLHFFPKPDEANVKGALTKWENKRDNVFALWNAKHNAGIRGTAWGVANVLTENNQWNRGIREGAKGREAFDLAGAGFDTATNNFRNDVFALVGARAGVTL